MSIVPRLRTSELFYLVYLIKVGLEMLYTSENESEKKKKKGIKNENSAKKTQQHKKKPNNNSAAPSWLVKMRNIKKKKLKRIVTLLL